MNGDIVRAGFGEYLQLLIGIGDHQMHIKRKFRGTPAGFHKKRTHCNGGDEMTIHDIQMKPVCASGFTGGDFISQFV